jgi:hypothetical protein
MTAERPPFKVIFLHIPKAAGTTVRRLFQANYGSAVYFPSVPAAPDTPFLRYIREETDTFARPPAVNGKLLEKWHAWPPEKQDAIDAFVGHFWYGVHNEIPEPARYVTMLRDPVERVLSHYAHRTATQGLDVPLDRYLTTERDWDISNGQTRRLATSGFEVHMGDVTETMFDVAAERLIEEFAAVGTTERFDESVVSFARVLGWHSTAYVVSNESSDRTARHELSPPLLERLVERNQFDDRLHALASDQLDKGLLGIDVPLELQRLRRASRRLRVRTNVKARIRKVLTIAKKPPTSVSVRV